MEYKWKEGARSSRLDAQKCGAVLERLRQKNGGTITADIVLREARKKRSPLHGGFEWDDTEAARQYRLEQARGLIRSITVQVIGGGESDVVRAFVHIDGGDYEEIHAVLRTRDRRQALLDSAMRELLAFRTKYEQLSELAEVFAAVDKAAS